MTTSRLLYLSAHQLTAYRWRSGVLANDGVFAASEDGLRAFADYLQRNASSTFAILANVSEEGFHVETIPFLRGADRRAMIERKLGQLYFNAALTTSLSLGYERNKRKDERVLLAALSNSEFFAPWLDAIAGRQIALSGVYSLPLLAPLLLRRLGIDAEPCLLLSVQDQSVRQSYFEKGELHFSRLTPLQNSSISGIAQAFAAEALKLQQYLASQRLIGRQQSITAYLLAHRNTRQAIEQSCTDTATLRYCLVDIEECALRTGAREVPQNSHCEPIFLNLLVASPPRVQFADATLRHDYHLAQGRAALYGLGAATLLCCLAFAGKQVFDVRQLTTQTQSLRGEAAADRQRYQDIVRSFPNIPTDTETLRRVIDRYAILEQQSATPEPLYREISRALAKAPAIEIESIDWQAGGSEPGAVAAGTTSAPAAGADETALVRGVVKAGANASARQVLAAFNGLLGALEANPALRLSVVQRPFDIESAKLLKGGETTVEDGKPRAFALQITRKAGP